MIQRLNSVNLSEDDFEEFIKYTTDSLMEFVSSENLKKLLIVISKEDFLLNFEMEEKEYKWLEKAFDIRKEKAKLNRVCKEVRKIDEEKLRQFRSREQEIININAANNSIVSKKKTANEVFRPRGEKKKSMKVNLEKFENEDFLNNNDLNDNDDDDNNRNRNRSVSPLANVFKDSTNTKNQKM